MLRATGAKVIQPASLQVSFPIWQTTNRRPLQTATEEEETLSSHCRGQRALAAHRHVTALSTAATPWRPAGLQNDTTLLACSCDSFFISAEVVGGSLSFDSLPALGLACVRFLAVQQIVPPTLIKSIKPCNKGTQVDYMDMVHF